MVNLEELLETPRKSASSYAEICPWFSMLPGGEAILCQDGTILGGFTLPGMDSEGLTDAHIDHMVDIVQKSFSIISENIIVWSYVEKLERDTYIRSEYTNQVAQYIEDKWEEKLKTRPQSVVNHSIFFGFRKSNLADSFFESVNYKINEEGVAFFTAVTSAIFQSFSTKRTVASIQGHLNENEAEFSKILDSVSATCANLLGMERLKGEWLLGELFSRFNVASPPGPVHEGRYGAYLPQRMAADKVVRRGNLLRFEGPSEVRNVGVISTTDFPDELSSSHIESLLKLPGEFCVCQIFEVLDSAKAQAMIQKLEGHYRMEVKSLSTRIAERFSGNDLGKVNTGNLLLADDAQDALVEITSENLMYGFHSMRILAYGKTERQANECIEKLSGSLRATGYTVTRETTGLLGAFLSSLPGNAKVNPRKYLASVANIADLFPFLGFSTGVREHRFFSKVLNRPVPNHVTFNTESTVPYGFNCHEHDLGHFLVLGGAGGGKTTMVNLLLALFQKYTPCNSFIFDKDYSTSVMSVLLGGKHLDINTSGKTKVKMNPVRRMLVNKDILALIEWIGMLAVGTSGERLSDAEKGIINMCVRQVAELNPAIWRLGTIYTQIAGASRALAMKISKYVDVSQGEDDPSGVGQFSSFFDNEEDAFELSNLVCIETGQLLEIDELAGPFLEYAFYCIDKKLNGSTPAFIYIEEAWFAIKNPLFYAKLMDWLRTLRKKKAFVGLATQAMSEFEQLPDLSAFLVNLPTRIFLPSITNTVEENRHLYQSIFNLNEQQLNLLKSAQPKRDYLIVKGTETKLVRADMPDIVIKINDACAVESSRHKALEMAESGISSWPMSYIKEHLHA